MLRNEKIDKKIRIGVIAAAWIVYLIIGFSGNSGNSNETVETDSNLTEEQAVASENSTESQEITESVSSTVAETTIESEEENADPYSDLNDFIDSFNNVSDIKIVSQEEIDIHDKSGGYYRTEFRLSAFDNAVAYHVIFDDDSSADLIDTADWTYGSTINGFIARIYVLASSKESFEAIFRTACSVMHSDITDADVDEAVDKMMKPSRYEEMEFLYSSGSGLVGDTSYTYTIKEKNSYFQFFLD